VTCAAPLGLDLLLDLWIGDSSATRAEEAWEHVFGCAPCTARLAEVAELAAAVRRLTETGRFRAAVAPSLVDLLAARGLRIRTYHPRLGETIPCGAAPEDELLVGRLAVELRGVTRLDLAVCDDGWVERARMVDVPVDRRRGEVVIAERVDRARTGGSEVLRFRLLAVDDAAGERELGSFALAHDSRGPPGSG
jgi:hypothetical protein